MQEVFLMDLSFVEKLEIEDEEKQKHLIYKCKYCESILLDQKLSILSFINEWENQNNKNNEVYINETPKSQDKL